MSSGQDTVAWRACTHHKDVRMKTSSMKTAPNGRMPPTSTLNAGAMYHGWGGTWRGILLVRTGASDAGRLKPK